MRMEHKAGDKMFVDYAGKKLQVSDPETGEIKDYEVFVCVLGASQLSYIEAVASQRKVKRSSLPTFFIKVVGCKLRYC